MSNLERRPALTGSTATSTEPAPPARSEPEVLTAREVDLGDGMPVRRLLPKRGRTTIGAWCFVDHFGPLDTVAPARHGLRVPPHPHTSLQTVTWLVEGTVLHRDSLGSEQLIRPGQLNLMTAGHGIAHSEESPPERPPLLHGVQLWTALPSGHDRVEPAFDHLAELPAAATSGMRLTVLMGELLGAVSPARAYSPIVGADITVDAATDDDLPLRPDFEYGVLAMSGRAAVEGVTVEPGRMVYLHPGRTHVGVRSTGPARLLLLGGEPFGEPIVMWWNFVAHTYEEIAEAHADWRAGSSRFGEVAGYPYGPRLEVPPLPPGRLRPR